MSVDFTRREFMGGMAVVYGVSAVTSGNEKARDLIIPPRLKQGDTIGLVTPASPVFEPSDIKVGVRAIEGLGFKVRVGKNVGAKGGYLAGTDEERAQDLMDMFSAPEVRAIMALRGGYGSLRILPFLDYETIRQNPKIFLGYSDITSLHLAIHKQAGIVTYHGAVALSTFNEYSTGYLLKTLMEPEPVGPIEPGESAIPMRIGPTANTGSVTGALTGGNLTLVCASLGTPYEIETDGKVLFLEEVGEEPYSLDRMLTQLDHAGKLGSAKAVLIDRCQRCKPAEYKPAFDNTLSIEEIIVDRFGSLNVPVIYGLSIGHVADKPVLPYGINIALNFDYGTMEIIQGAVI